MISRTAGPRCATDGGSKHDSSDATHGHLLSAVALRSCPAVDFTYYPSAPLAPCTLIGLSVTLVRSAERPVEPRTEADHLWHRLRTGLQRTRTSPPLRSNVTAAAMNARPIPWSPRRY